MWVILAVAFYAVIAAVALLGFVPPLAIDPMHEALTSFEPSAGLAALAGVAVWWVVTS